MIAYMHASKLENSLGRAMFGIIDCTTAHAKS